MSHKKAPALIIIDVQKGFDDIKYWGSERNNPDAEKNMKKLLSLWRIKRYPVYHIQHTSSLPDSPLAIGNPGHDFKPACRPLNSEKVIQKSVNSAFIGTNLQQQLKERGIEQLVIIGLTTDHCVSTTTRMAANLGYDTFLISDATAAFNKTNTNGDFPAEVIHQVSLATIDSEFATVMTTKEMQIKIEFNEL